ncbi:hypothetical protein PMG71_21175 [Roseofilum sp. BLCC_M154]|uniref:Uncharacterized protein n=1 Tax=Roseofilum acuticapitatum BLCC-M154 TaxID=3022444 RepID=A0ABT7AYG6_9CYAN|nr:hypothetical protein [Roseofilum acuticapitatum]MDJ1171947.1 hypothetical protein [Roseofilum acuticapitatum BLCC-M154]
MQKKRQQIHDLVDQLPEEYLQEVWTFLVPLCVDAYVLTMIQVTMDTIKPGDFMTREEALGFLHHR